MIVRVVQIKFHLNAEVTFSRKITSSQLERIYVEKKPKVTVHVIINALDINWSKTIHRSQTIQIPGFSLPMIARIGLKIEIYIKSNGGTRLKVSVLK